MFSPVLAGQPVAHRIGEDCFEPFTLRARNCGLFVRDQTEYSLLRAASHRISRVLR